MAKKERKVLKHPFYDRFTIPGAIILFLLAWLVYQQFFAGFIGGFIQVFLSIVSPEKAWIGNIVGDLAAIFGAFLVLSVFWRWFYPQFEGGLHGGSRILKWTGVGLLVCAAMLVVQLVTVPLSDLAFPSIVRIFAALTAGICEEIVYRGIVTSYLMRQWRGENKILPVILFSSAIFGLIHMLNLTAGAPLVTTIFQVINAFAIGTLLCALFVRSGNLLPGIVMHAMVDAIALSNNAGTSQEGVMQADMVFDSGTVIGIIAMVVFLVITLILTRPAVRSEICALWEKKWKKA